MSTIEASAAAAADLQGGRNAGGATGGANDRATGGATDAPGRESGGLGSRLLDARFAKRLVMLNACVPLVLLAWDAYHHQLGANEVNFAIRTTGIIGLVFLVLSLIVTPLRRFTGWNALIAVRRNLGVFAFVYLASHFTIFFVFDRGGSISSTLHEMVERVYLWFGTAALVLMIPLAVTSTDGMVSRFGARRWKRLHRLAYPIVIAGVVHYYLLVKSDVRQPLAFAILIGALLVYRVVAHYVDLRTELAAARDKLVRARAGAPARRRKFWSGELEVARIFEETPDVKTFRLVARGGGPLPFDHVAGQYLNLALTIDGKRVNRSYTIASSPTRTDYCEISVKRAPAGTASRHLHATLREGSALKVSAPAGRFVFDPGKATRCVLIAGGVGITPMMSTVRSLTDRCWSGSIYLLFSVRRLTDIVFREELDYLSARFPNLHVLVTLTGEPDAAWQGERGQITRAMVARFVPDLRRGPILVCGPDPMMAAMRRLLVDEIGIPAPEVLEEAFVSPPAASERDPGAATPGEAPASAGADPGPVLAASAGEAASVTFQRAGKSAELSPELTVLEAAEDAGVAIPFECRSGICGQCKTRLISGTVTMEVQDALTAIDRSRRLILACQARAVGDVVVDA
ncbi:MAG TPA: ferric reductase-like transmembrane domain-containing protein [Kofleriaceae bacterium]|nr:ferric reductase-like transmembrane domain-containing protein [Kofleriaceae bacterium]